MHCTAEGPALAPYPGRERGAAQLAALGEMGEKVRTQTWGGAHLEASAGG
eukprot:CAMPEP_0204368290 /NCGR_PEP_ID=MMETSP0469-20131031/44071_1 /ASSEMBLY_ACC=CAM_ASM_000384 /TAXON_ID=2969 /ORGANISM="Oxyrrhis marina" /LENGTH=49 /DNA_ID= /DNA_START= /DNA_END= /DNA_ORIENTATION=